ncbi:MAG: MATE family efflux transporter [Oscillospiraceae bacterium]
MAKSTVKDLTVGSPMRLIVGFMLPLLFGMLFQQLYNMVDTAIVGQYLGITALAGVGSTGSINFLVLGFVQGVCAGFAIPVAQMFGSKDLSAMRRYVANTIWLSAIFAVVITTLTCLLCTNILQWMGTPADCFNEAYNYIFVIFLGIPVTFLYNILSGIIRSVGDSRTPVYFLIISSLLNVGLDLFMIVTLGMGVSGAAWATVISQLVSGILCLVYMIKRFDILRIKKEELPIDRYYIGRLCAVGLPMGLQYSITAIGSILIQTAVNALGSTYVAAVTAACKVSQLLCCPFDAMGSTMATYSGQNIGAGEVKRIRRGLFDCSVLGVGYAIVGFLIILFIGTNIANLFINDTDGGNIEELLALSKQFLLTNGSFYIPLAFVNIVRFLIQGMGFSQVAVFAGVFEMIARGTVALFIAPALGFDAICFANPAAWILADMFLIPTFFFCYHKMSLRFGYLEKSRQPSEQ